LRQLVKLEQKYETDEVILAIAAGKSKLLQKYGISQVNDQLLNQELSLSVNVGMGATDPNARLAKFMGALTAYANVAQMQLPNMDMAEVGKEVFALAGYRDGARFSPQQEEGSPNAQVMQQAEQMVKEAQQMAQQAQQEVEQRAKELDDQEMQLEHKKIALEQSKVDIEKQLVQAQSQLGVQDNTAEINARYAMEQQKMQDEFELAKYKIDRQVELDYQIAVLNANSKENVAAMSAEL